MVCLDKGKKTSHVLINKTDMMYASFYFNKFKGTYERDEKTHWIRPSLIRLTRLQVCLTWFLSKTLFSVPRMFHVNSLDTKPAITSIASNNAVCILIITRKYFVLFWGNILSTQQTAIAIIPCNVKGLYLLFCLLVVTPYLVFNQTGSKNEIQRYLL